MRANQPFHTLPLLCPVNLTNCYYVSNPKYFRFAVVGRIVAFSSPMILITLQMKPFAERRKELSQTIALLVGSIRTEKGCRRCDFCRSMEDENRLYLFEEWDTREDLDTHLKSACFTVIRGTLNLLQEPYQMVSHTVASEKP